MNFKNFAFCLVVILCSTIIVAHGTKTPSTSPAKPAVAKNNTNPGSDKLIYIPVIVSKSFFTVILEDVIETYQAKILLHDLIQTELSLVVIRAEELGIIWITAIVNELINEVQLLKNLAILIVEELEFSNVQIKYLIARGEIQLDRQYQLGSYRVDAAIVPYIRGIVIQIRRFINARIIHQRRLRSLLLRLNRVGYQYGAINRRLENEVFIDKNQEQKDMKAKAILNVATALARDFLKYDIIKDNFFKEVDEAELEVTEVATLVNEFYILSKMAALHAKEVEAGILADILRQINFALVADERHQIYQLRVVDPRRFIQIRRAERIIYPLRRKLRHMLAAIAYYDAQIAKTSWEIEGAVELFALGEFIAVSWDYTVLNWNCLYLIPI